MNFGYDVSLSTNNNRAFLVIGAPARDNSQAAGYAEVYELDNGDWVLRDQLGTGRSNPEPHFGTSVALNWSEGNPTIAVGMPGATVNQMGDGAIQTYTYSYSESSWLEGNMLTQKGLPAGAGFGHSIEMLKAPNRIVMSVGAPGIESDQFSGRAFIYQKPDNGTSWQKRGRLNADNLDSNSSFGRSLSIFPANGKLHYLAGAPGYNSDVEDQGRSFQYQLPDPVDMPALKLDNQFIETTVPENDSASKQINIQSTGSSALTWELISDTPDWITLEKQKGSIPAGSSTLIDIGFYPVNLPVGTFTDELIFETNSTEKDCLHVEMKMKVTNKEDVDLLLNEWSQVPDTLEAEGIVPLQENEIYAKNKGTDPVDSSFSVGLYVSPDSSLSTDFGLVATAMAEPGLGAKQFTSINFSPGAAVPDEFTGSAYMIMKADHQSDVSETNESNNRMIQQVYIKEPRHPSISFVAPVDSIHETLAVGNSTKRKMTFVNQGRDSLFFSIPGFTDEYTYGKSLITLQQTEQDTVPPYLQDVTPGDGSVAVKDSTTIKLVFDAEGVAKGVYRDTLSMVTNVPANRTLVWPMKVEINESTGIGNKKPVPDNFALRQNYPNPFNPTTRIEFSLPKATEVKLTVYDVLGRRVTTLVDSKRKAGRYSVTFDARNLSSGVYIYRIKAGEYTESNKMLLLK